MFYSPLYLWRAEFISLNPAFVDVSQEFIPMIFVNPPPTTFDRRSIINNLPNLDCVCYF